MSNTPRAAGTTGTAAELVARSHRLGADPRNTNYAGGNTSAKGTGTDPVTGEPVELLWVKGSGGDLGTLTEAGLAVLRLDRLRSLSEVYPGVDREDEMVARVNDTDLGLVSYLYTADLARGLRLAGRIESGMVGLNRGLVSDPAAPFGGTKQSGIGREGGHEGMLDYLESKYVAVSW